MIVCQMTIGQKVSIKGLLKVFVVVAPFCHFFVEAAWLFGLLLLGRKTFARLLRHQEVGT